MDAEICGEAQIQETRCPKKIGQSSLLSLTTRETILTEGRSVVTKPYLLFDVGGTLVYPDPEAFAQVCGDFGYPVSSEEVLASFFKTLYQLDADLRETGSSPLAGTFLARGLEGMGVAPQDAPKIVAETERRKAPQGLWTYTTSRVRNTLERLQAEGFPMAAISNSDGTVEQQLKDVGLHRYFAQVFDSAIVGVEKPDPEIFHIALGELGIQPGECLYVGDIFMYDVQGANRAGIAAVHIDNPGLYQEWPGVHFGHISELAEALIQGTLTLEEPRLFVFPREG